MIADIVQQIAEAAVFEARTVPKLLLRDHVLVWRAFGGAMIPMTRPILPPSARITAVDGDVITYEVT